MVKYRLAILKNESNDDHLSWIKACEDYSKVVNYDIIDLLAENWLEQITAEDYDYLLTRPPGTIPYYKQLYDERIYILAKVLNLPVYPNFHEQLIYENKRMLSYFLQAKHIPHPQTWVFYDKLKAQSFIRNAEFPLVAKTNIGAGGSGVQIIRNRKYGLHYIDKAFSKKGIQREYLPNFRKGEYIKRIKKRLGKLDDSIEYFKNKKKAATIEPQKWFVILQEYIKTEYEWRCVVIDDSYFGHKKIRSIGEKISGTSKVRWDSPGKELLNFLKHIIEQNELWSQAIDLFYDDNKGYLVNELQCFWGSKNPHQMLKDGKPGRYVYKDDKWLFEEGVFNHNNSYNLRMQHVLKLLNLKNEYHLMNQTKQVNRH